MTKSKMKLNIATAVYFIITFIVTILVNSINEVASLFVWLAMAGFWILMFLRFGNVLKKLLRIKE